MNNRRLIEFLGRSKERYVLILRGIPGAGKTYLCQEIQTALEATKEIARIAVDDFFTVDGKYVFDASRLNEAYDATFNDYLDKLDDPEVDLILVDNPNIRSYEVSPYVTCASVYGVPHGVATIHCDPCVASSRHEKKMQESKVFDMHQTLINQDFPVRWHRFEIFP